MSETIQDKLVVGVTYILKNDNGDTLDTATSSDPFYYLHGASNIVPGLEEELTGLKVGDKKSVKVAPEKGYGEINDQLKVKVGKESFPEGTDVSPGMQFAADVGTGQPLPFTVEKVEGEEIFLDGNHPLAGQTLHFEIEVVNIRAATEDEVSHGHAHGADGVANH
ncbi:peptidylprolyl isomerase [bacterium]|nr:peptidylprolyl isomerase [bacterium]